METPELDRSIDHRLLEALSRVATVLRTDDWGRAKQIGLTPTQLAILELLQGRRDGLAVKALAAHLGVSQPTATDSIISLKRKGLVEKRTVAGDKRAVAVALTTQGNSLVRSTATMDAAVGRAVERLDDAELERLLLTLVKLIRELQEANAIPVQRMCVSCRYFAPFAHAHVRRPHHCNFVDAPFGQRHLRIDCRDHAQANPPFQAATWNAFQSG